MFNEYGAPTGYDQIAPNRDLPRSPASTSQQPATQHQQQPQAQDPLAAAIAGPSNYPTDPSMHRWRTAPAGRNGPIQPSPDRMMGAGSAALAGAFGQPGGAAAGALQGFAPAHSAIGAALGGFFGGHPQQAQLGRFGPHGAMPVESFGGFAGAGATATGQMAQPTGGMESSPDGPGGVPYSQRGTIYHPPGGPRIDQEPAPTQSAPFAMQTSPQAQFQPAMPRQQGGAPQQHQSDRDYFFSLLPEGGSLTPDQLTALGPQLAERGIKLAPNAKGVNGKIKLPNGQIIDVIQGADSGLNKAQWLEPSAAGQGMSRQHNPLMSAVQGQSQGQPDDYQGFLMQLLQQFQQ
jgi:hypothetical protein